jgi:peptide/nickel transport system ATP-binding protein
MADAILSVQHLSVGFDTPDGVVHAVNDVSFEVHAGETVCIVGESGSGKSVTASSILRLNNSITATTSGNVFVDGVDVLNCSDYDVRKIRGSEVAMVFQDPLSALNPYYTVGRQIAEAYEVHHPSASKDEVRTVVLDMLRKVGIPNPEKRHDEYPHQFSGGMRQRIVIAIALVNKPKILIADEPTTALDVTVQAQILDLMIDLQRETNMAIILITHDLGVVAEIAQKVLVMYAGRVVEAADVESLYSLPTHPYSWGLLGAVASLDHKRGSELRTIAGTPPSLISIPSGCAFRPRCDFYMGDASSCHSTVPALQQVGGTSSLSACHLSHEQLVSIGKGKVLS